MRVSMESRAEKMREKEHFLPVPPYQYSTRTVRVQYGGRGSGSTQGCVYSRDGSQESSHSRYTVQCNTSTVQYSYSCTSTVLLLVYEYEYNTRTVRVRVGSSVAYEYSCMVLVLYSYAVRRTHLFLSGWWRFRRRWSTSAVKNGAQ